MVVIEPELVIKFKGIRHILKSLIDKVQYAQKKVQPLPSKESSCTVMLTHNLVDPDWIVIPCNEHILGLLICQKGINETKSSINRPFLNKTSMNTCQHSTFLFKNRCVLFKKYIIFTNLSKLQNENDLNILEYTILELKYMKILQEYFTYIQHFYSQPIQFTILVYHTNTYLSYAPVHTQYFLKLTWIQTQNKNPISKYDGYIYN